MPGADGYSLIREVRRREAQNGQHLPSGAITAYAGSHDRDRALAAGFDRYVSKPINRVAIVEAVVSMRVNEGYTFSRDTIASVLTSGLLGEVYVGLDAGGDTQILGDGGAITMTQSAVIIEKLISQFLFDKATQPPPGK